METGSGSRQRSPWFYVLLGCGGLAGLMCLAGTIFVFFVGKQVKNVEAGVNDPAQKQKNAIAQLGAIPEGYNVVASLVLPFGVAKTSVLTDQPLTEDGGVPVDGNGRIFMYRTQMMQKEQLAVVKDFFAGKPVDSFVLQQAGLTFEEKSIAKRSELTVEGRKLLLVVMHGAVTPMQPSVSGLNTVIFFECADDVFRLATWTQKDPVGDGKGEPSLAGTVADEAEIAKFIKPINPCGK